MKSALPYRPSDTNNNTTATARMAVTIAFSVMGPSNRIFGCLDLCCGDFVLPPMLGVVKLIVARRLATHLTRKTKQKSHIKTQDTNNQRIATEKAMLFHSNATTTDNTRN